MILPIAETDVYYFYPIRLRHRFISIFFTVSDVRVSSGLFILEFDLFLRPSFKDLKKRLSQE